MFDDPPYYSAAKFNSWQREMNRNLLADGVGTRASISPDGQRLVIELSDFWKHPWTITPNYEYDADGDGAWVAYVEPGFLNGRDVWTSRDGVYSTLTDEDTGGLVINGWRDVLRGRATIIGEELGHEAGEGYPPALALLGAKSAGKAGAGITDIALDGDREVRACDVALIVPRISVRQAVEVLDPYSLQETISISSIMDDSYVRANLEHPYRLGAFAKWEPPQDPTAIDRLLGIYNEPSTDEIRIATIYALSPPDYTETDEPDQAWSLVTQYNCFWNLQHASLNQPPEQNTFKPITFVTGLALGMANLIIAGLLAPANDASMLLYASLSKTTFKGRFYIE